MIYETDCYRKEVRSHAQRIRNKDERTRIKEVKVDAKIK